MLNRIKVSYHFSLHEFANSEGLVAICAETVQSLEQLRQWLWDVQIERIAQPHMVGSELASMLADCEVAIHITCGLRTEEENAALATRLGFIDERLCDGAFDEPQWLTEEKATDLEVHFDWDNWPKGKVSRTSKHLLSQGASAVDIKAKVIGVTEWLPSALVAEGAMLFFDYVNANYSDGHVHVDNRNSVEMP